MTKITFGEKVKTSLKSAGLSQKVLAISLGFDPTVLTHKVNGKGRTLLTKPDVRGVIKALAKLEAITHQSEAMDLLLEADCPNLQPKIGKPVP